MSHSTRKLAHRLHFLRLPHLTFHLRPLANVGDEADDDQISVHFHVIEANLDWKLASVATPAL